MLPTFLISLARTPERRAIAAERLKAAALPFELFDAVDGAALSPDDVTRQVDQAAATDRLGRPLSPGEIGCALSHRAIYARMLEEDLPAAVVMEDDAIPTPQTKDVIAQLADGPEKLVLLYHAFTYVPRWGDGGRVAALPGGHALHRPLVTPRCTVAYYLTREAAQVLHDATSRIAMQADWPVHIEETLGAKVVNPHVVHHDVYRESTISDHDHERRWELTAWDHFEDWTCVPYLRDRRRWDYRFSRYVKERLISRRIWGPPHQPCVGCGTDSGSETAGVD